MSLVYNFWIKYLALELQDFCCLWSCLILEEEVGLLLRRDKPHAQAVEVTSPLQEVVTDQRAIVS